MVEKEVINNGKEQVDRIIDEKIQRLRPIPVMDIRLDSQYLYELRYTLIINALRGSPVKTSVAYINQAILEMKMILASKFGGKAK